MAKVNESPRSPGETDSQDQGAPAPPVTADRTRDSGANHIAETLVIKGELSADVDLNIDGHVEGSVALHKHVLTIGTTGRIKARVFAKSVVVLGEAKGDITATNKVYVSESASVDGSVTAPRLEISQGAGFRGHVDMARPRPAARARRTIETGSSRGPSR